MIELTLNTLRFALAFLYIIILYDVIKIGGIGIENTNEKNKKNMLIKWNI